jgi:hypothetical protein
MERGRVQLLRCAIYTREVLRGGLEQDVNSLRAQRKASEAFAKSQHGEDWCLVKDRLR